MMAPLIVQELKYHVRQRLFQILAIGFFVLGCGVTGGGWFELTAQDDTPLFVNGPHHLALAHLILSLSILFVAALFASNAVLRDMNCNFQEVTLATPIPAHTITLAQILGAWIASLGVLSFASLGFWVGTWSPLADPDFIGDFSLFSILKPWTLFFGLGSLIAVAVYASVAILTQRRTYVWISVICFFVLASMSGTFASLIGSNLFAHLVDPMAIEAFNLATSGLSGAEQNTRPIALDNALGANRIIWLILSALFVLLSLKFTRKELRFRKVRKKQLRSADKGMTGSFALPVAGLVNNTAHGAQFFSRLRFELNRTLFNPLFICLTIGCVGLLILLIMLRAEMTSIPQMATSAYLASLIGKSANLILILLAVFFGSELVWRDTNARFVELLHATPVRSTTLLGAKWTALCLILLSILALLVIVCMIAQTIIGAQPIEPLTYIKVVSSDFGIILFLSSFFVFMIQAFVRNASVGLIAGAGFVLAMTQIIPRLPGAHPLMSFGSIKFGPYSDMNGFLDGLVKTNLVLLAFWLGLALVLAVFTVRFWPRGFERRVRGVETERIFKTRSPAMAALMIGMFASVVSGGWIVLAMAQTEGSSRFGQDLRAQAEFEQRLNTMPKSQDPGLTAVDVKADIFPSKRMATFEATYTLTNQSDGLIERVIISPPTAQSTRIVSLAIEGANPVTDDGELGFLVDRGYRVYQFAAPMRPGDVHKLHVLTELPSSAVGRINRVTRQGAFLTTEQVLPIIGLRPNFIRNPAQRRKMGLDPPPERSGPDYEPAREINFLQTGTDLVAFRTVICTDGDQTPLAVGTRLRAYQDGDRNCAQFEMPRRDGFFFAFMSGTYQETSLKAGDIPLSIYASNGHAQNLPNMSDALVIAVALFSDQFGPYPFDQLSVAEFPYARHAQSHAGLIAMGERMAFLVDTDAGDGGIGAPLDLASYVTAHEVAHQWFGHLILPADAKGAEVLTESLAEYAASIAMEKQYGWAEAKRLRDRNLRLYLNGRETAGEREVPLGYADGEDYLTFNKGHLVFWSLRHRYGNEPINAALRELIGSFAGNGPPYPTTSDLFEALKRHLPEGDRFSAEFFQTVTIWDVRIEDLELRETDSDAPNSINLEFGLQKWNGRVLSADGFPENAIVEIGYFDRDPATEDAVMISLETLDPARQGAQTVTLNPPKGATYVMLDPRGLLIEEDEINNIAKLP